MKGASLREALESKTPFHVYRHNLFNTLIEEIKELGEKPPRYAAYLDKKEAEGKFLHDILSLLSKMPWHQLTIIINAGVTTTQRPAGLVTKGWTEAFLFAQHVVFLAFEARISKGAFRLTDPEALYDWPVKERQRPSKEDRVMLKDEDLERDDDDEDEEGTEPEDDDGDEKPVKKAKKVKKEKKKSKADDDDDDAEDDKKSADDDDEDDDKPVKKGFSKKKGKSKPDVDDDDDEPEGKGAKVKKSKKAKPDKKEKKKGKVEKAAKIEVNEKSTVLKIGKRDKGGKKTKLLDLIPKSGIKVKELIAAAKEEGLKSSRVLPWVKGFVKYGYVKVS